MGLKPPPGLGLKTMRWIHSLIMRGAASHACRISMSRSRKGRGNISQDLGLRSSAPSPASAWYRRSTSWSLSSLRPGRGGPCRGLT